MKKLLSLSISVIFVAVGLTVLGQEKSEAPQYKDGDSWVFRSKIGGSNPLRNSNDPIGDYELTYVGGKTRALKIDGAEKKATSDDMTALRLMLWSEGQNQYIQFPMSVGKKWSYKYPLNIASTTVMVSGDAEVTGIEDVSTPAGTFHAFKIERRDIGSKGIDWRRVYYYSPQTQCIVKFHWETALGREHDVELVKFRSTH